VRGDGHPSLRLDRPVLRCRIMTWRQVGEYAVHTLRGKLRKGAGGKAEKYTPCFSDCVDHMVVHSGRCRGCLPLDGIASGSSGALDCVPASVTTRALNFCPCAEAAARYISSCSLMLLDAPLLPLRASPLQAAPRCWRASARA
jgi:hypothetical protein